MCKKNRIDKNPNIVKKLLFLVDIITRTNDIDYQYKKDSLRVFRKLFTRGQSVEKNIFFIIVNTSCIIGDIAFYRGQYNDIK